MTLRRHNLKLLDAANYGALARVSDDIGEHGLVVFEDDGIDPETWRITRKHLDRFFALPLADKQRYEFPENGRQRGYSSPRTEHARDQPPEAGDLKEFWQEGPADWAKLGLLPNITTDSPGFDEIRRRVHTQLSLRTAAVLRAIAPILKVDPEWLVRYSSDGDTIVRFLRYFNLEGIDFPPGTLRSAKHTDINLITLLKTMGEGLVVQSKTGAEIELDIGPQELVVQMGDYMEVLSGGLLPATTHWVKNMPGVRTSIALFNHPHPLRRIDTLPHLRHEGFTWDACTERAATEKRLIEIGILEGPAKLGHEFVSQGYQFEPEGIVHPSPWTDHN